MTEDDACPTRGVGCKPQVNQTQPSRHLSPPVLPIEYLVVLYISQKLQMIL